MKRIFFMVTCLLLTVVAVWGEPAQSTLNLTTSIAEDHHFAIYMANDDNATSFSPAAPTMSIDATSTNTRRYFKVFYSGNQEKQKPLEISIRATSFLHEDSWISRSCPVLLHWYQKPEDAVWSSGTTPALIELKAGDVDGAFIPSGFVPEVTGIEGSCFAVDWGDFDKLPAGNYLSEISINITIA